MDFSEQLQEKLLTVAYRSVAGSMMKAGFRYYGGRPCLIISRKDGIARVVEVDEIHLKISDKGALYDGTIDFEKSFELPDE